MNKAFDLTTNATNILIGNNFTRLVLAILQARFDMQQMLVTRHDRSIEFDMVIYI